MPCLWQYLGRLALWWLRQVMPEYDQLTAAYQHLAGGN